MNKQEVIKLVKATIKSEKEQIKAIHNSAMLWDDNDNRINDYINRNNELVKAKAILMTAEAYLKLLKEME
ncbi:MAG: hypothetical protein Unbinned6284contig1004_44 [Prokaryotic dsDNA virus sp.]|nr:MAG: hypothetical protein Unbinned6284contig1004_44 [Prokaryotic dsDNA virus sp.]|tara:strand:+ start:6773 stop:6982 length:210 start_codon:yes stop_codon:yes gene_type:complete